MIDIDKANLQSLAAYSDRDLVAEAKDAAFNTWRGDRARNYDKDITIVGEAWDASWAAAITAYESATAPQWSDEVPTEAGWYWWRRDEESATLCSEIWLQNESQNDWHMWGKRVARYGTYQYPETLKAMRISGWGGQWSGPIQTPEGE